VPRRKNRLEKGEQAQVDIFGEKMRGFSNSRRCGDKAYPEAELLVGRTIAERLSVMHESECKALFYV
jgi:hypothetical protein